MEKHVKTTGILWIAKGILGIFVGFLVFAIMLGIGFFANIQGGEEAFPILGIIGLFVAGLLTVLSIPEILAGIGILKFKQWGKILGLVMAALNLLDIPVGTALAIYSFWVLLKDDSQELFS